MSCNYAEGLSPYDNKGKLGLPERFDSNEVVKEKCEKLVEWIKAAKHVVVHTGAGISTSAGIPDFRGPQGVWTLERDGKSPSTSTSFLDALPTKTHLALKKLLETKYIHFIVSQNIDGLHLRSGLARKYLAELHGNIFVEQCNTCNSQFIRMTPTESVGKKCLETNCKRYENGRICRGKLYDTVLDWEHDLPEKDLDLSFYHSSVADLNICLGTTLQIVPSGNLPLKNKKFGGTLVIVNLQPTKHDKKADLILNTYVDNAFEHIMNALKLEIPQYELDLDPINAKIYTDWNIQKRCIKDVAEMYNTINKNYRKRKFNEDNLKKEQVDIAVDFKTSA